MSAAKTTIRTKINEKFVDEEGILWIRVIDGAHIDLDSLKEDASVNPLLTNNKKALAIYDSRAFFTIEPAARDYVKSVIDPHRIATAVLTDKPGVRLLVNFFIRFNRPKTPMKMFSDEQKALEWLRGFKIKSLP